MKHDLALVGAFLLIGMGTPALGQDVSGSQRQAVQDVEGRLVIAFNRQDAAGVASLFTDDGIRVTPGGILEGREAIRKDLEKRFSAKFHDLSLEAKIVRGSDDGTWAAGEWALKIGDQPAHGYYMVNLVREGNGFKLRYDAFNVVPPASEKPASPQR